MLIDQMASEDRQLLDLKEVRAVWDWLVRRFPDTWLTPDTHLLLDLNVDSLEWLSLTLELRDQTGVELPDGAIGRVETVRDVLREAIAGGAADGCNEDLLDRLQRPLMLLDDSQRRWLAPQRTALQWLGAKLLYLTRHVMTTKFGISVEGLTHLPPDGPIVLVPNHTSFLDPLALAAALPESFLGRIYWTGLTEIMFGNTFARLVSQATHVVPIEQRRGVLVSLAYGAAILDRGHPLVWFAEGGRSPDGQLKPFQPDIGFLLQARTVPVVPVWIGGAHRALPMGAKWPDFHPIFVRFGTPLSSSELEGQGRTGMRPHERITTALHTHVAALSM